MATVATGIPAGICAMDSRASSPPITPADILFTTQVAQDREIGAFRESAYDMIDAVESDTTRPPSLTLSGRRLEPWSVPGPSRRRPWATVALLAALALSLVEWATHHRRWTV